MPAVINGIGTWYYGKRRIHSRKGACEFCGRQADLASFDTTLFVVVFFVPVIPLQRKRILNQCSACRRHRALSLAKWEEAKAKDSADLLENLRRDPNNRDTLLRALGLSVAYQDEPLLNNLVESLPVERAGDAAVQVQLGNAYSYFARWPDAERAYRAALAIAADEAVSEQLALTLLKQGRPAEALPFVRHVIDNKKKSSAGLVYALVDGYQSQGLHEEALALMDERDQAFPEFAASKAYTRQRKSSLRYRATGKKTRSTLLAEGKAGYREGNWTARLPRWLAAAVLLSLPVLYFGSAFWIGQARKVFLVNGTSKPYSVAVQGIDYTLPPASATPVRVPEGEVQVAFRDARPGLEPVRARIETSFWGRPFAGHTFVINPDRSAIVLEEECYYAEANPPPSAPPKVHIGHEFYGLPGVDYEFQNFPQTIQVKEHSQIRKTRVGLGPPLGPEERLDMMNDLGKPERVNFAKLQLLLDPANSLYLHWLANQMSPDEVIALVQDRLDDRPIRVEWHRVYQTLMQRAHPETDLRPRYQKLLADTQGHVDAVYLLSRVNPDLDESDKLLKQAASANPPSGYAIAALGYRALCEGRFADARIQLEKALPLMAEKTVARQTLNEALLANGDYDPLLQALQIEAQSPGRAAAATVQMNRVYAIKGDAAKARQSLEAMLQMCEPPQREAIRKMLEAMVACGQGNVESFLKESGNVPSFESAFLRGNVKEAADLVKPDEQGATTHHCLIYLASVRSGDKDLAESQWKALLAQLGKGEPDERVFGDILAGKRPPGARLPQRLPINPGSKRALLAVLAQCHPDLAGEILPLAKKLNYHHDAIALCLRDYVQQH